MNVIEFKEVSKIYKSGFFKKEHCALKNFSLSIHKGETVALIGPNGAGKTTAIKLLTGLLFPSTGTILINGKNVSNSSNSNNLGFLPESPRLYEYLSAYEYLIFLGKLQGLDKISNFHDLVFECLDKVGLKRYKRQRIRSFSLGMIQRLGIAQAIMGKPEILILDEPLSSLDPYGRIEISDLIEEMKSYGKTIFFTSHIMNDVEKIAKRVVMLKRGQIIKDGTANDIIQDKGLEELFKHEAN